MKTIDAPGVRVTMRCADGHEGVFEVHRHIGMVPVHCPECPFHTPWWSVDEEEITLAVPVYTSASTPKDD